MIAKKNSPKGKRSLRRLHNFHLILTENEYNILELALRCYIEKAPSRSAPHKERKALLRKIDVQSWFPRSILDEKE